MRGTLLKAVQMTVHKQDALIIAD